MESPINNRTENSLTLSSVKQMTLKIDSLTKIYKCPYENCKKTFKEKGNLKTHIRVHVSSNI